MTVDQINRYRVSVKAYDTRAYFPYWEPDGTVTFWMGRTIIDAEPKTLEPGGVPKPLYGKHVGAGTRSGRVVPLVEGVFDHFATPLSFATMGSFLSREQADWMRELRPLWVPVLYDPDAKAKAIKVSTILMKMGVPSAAVILEGTEKDPAALGFNTMSQITRELERLPVPKRVCAYRVRITDEGTMADNSRL